MVKRTLFFSNPAYLSLKNEQLLVSIPKKEQQHSIPIEDIGVMVLENPQITLTNALISKLTENKAIVVHCNAEHLPSSLLQPVNGHTLQTERVREQIAISNPLKSNLWKQTVIAKIRNQAICLKTKKYQKATSKLSKWAKEVHSGDTTNREAIAAATYWKYIYSSQINDFRREPTGEAPNNLLNYGYAILRAITARAIVGTGLLPMFGIFHRNKYNAFCLADDIMEPYRVYVDVLVGKIIENNTDYEDLTMPIKQILLRLAAMDVVIDKKNSPLMVAMSRTTNSLYECFAGKKRNLLYPILDENLFEQKKQNLSKQTKYYEEEKRKRPVFKP